MKQSFTIIEVIIATTLLAVVMLSLFDIKSNNFYLVNKYQNIDTNVNYVLLGIDSNLVLLNDKNIYLDKIFKINDDNLRKYLKGKKVIKKTELKDVKSIKKDGFELKISEYSILYNLENSVSKNILRFKLSL